MSELTPSQWSLLPDEPEEALAPDPLAMALSAALRSRDGHFYELTGQVNHPGEPQGGLAERWQRFFAAGGSAGWQELSAKALRVQRRVLEDGASYNVHSDGPPLPGQDGEGIALARHWPLELLPMLIEPDEWRGIEAGIIQRARLLDAVMADTYGERRLLQQGLLPASLVLAHPQYLRAMHGSAARGDVHLHVLAFDLTRCADGHWWVVGQRTQAASGLGYVLENRLIIAQQFPEAFRQMAVQRLAASYRDFIQALTKLSPAGERSRVALLTPGPRNETYFEQAFLARYLGITLVEGADLTVRADKVYLKTLAGLERVHVLLRRVDDTWLDPLELRPDSILGVPGLLQAARAGEVIIANAPGSGWLESPGLAAFWPGVAESLLGEELMLPAIQSWWCGEESAWATLRPRLAEFIVVPTFSASTTTRSFAPIVAAELNDGQLHELAERIDADPTAYTLQARVKPTKQPVWTRGALEPRVAVLRVFAMTDGKGGWKVLPGGLTRVAPRRDPLADAWLSIQRGSLSADTWVMTDGEVDPTSLLSQPLQAADLRDVHWTVTSRAAENLFWLGRYTERAENSARLARHVIEASVMVQRGAMPPPMLPLLDALARRHGLVAADAPQAEADPRGGDSPFVRALLTALLPGSGVTSVGWNLRALQGCAQALRERLSPEAWRLIHETAAQFEQHLRAVLDRPGPNASVTDVLNVLARADTHLAAITGAQTDRMTRDDGWRLLSIGRQLERLSFHAEVLAETFEQDLALTEDGFALLLGVFDSTITYRAQFQARREAAPLLHLLVHDTDNPRSLGWVARTMRERFAKLARHDPGWAADIAADLPVPEAWPLAELAAPGPALVEHLQRAAARAGELSSLISQRYFAHVIGAEQRVWQ
ncbi:putative circularly permuted ATP-grasp superfamily protein/putative alpha-E superfamily protein [Pelomonas saccharophila]|uniref:Circularly permuted ATP-grasp superfamily protein/putative alpha-E superfamily protein n=1 Tax=Roseateles saccharophilus TaxID=304 RepID=A0ABU1YK55_ROSSA|nr:circularly permuted type 2 ATP-grasp protein [Roseateles saccharophilus]MDR7269245.1 putative circularly permuted ATP-grasp superfamily protein/putative alpha-E superfamily protein [Roseateles saccharophilus]